MPITLEDILAARQRIAGAVAVSPCPESPALSELTGMRVFCKLDELNHRVHPRVGRLRGEIDRWTLDWTSMARLHHRLGRVTLRVE